MNSELLKERQIEREFVFTASRSGGPGGQNVNKVNSRIELRFNVIDSDLLTAWEKSILLEKLGGRISSDGYLIIAAQNSRSQLKNREEAIALFYNIVSRALTVQKRRMATKPTLTSKTERLDKKKKHSATKRAREKRDFDDE